MILFFSGKWYEQYCISSTVLFFNLVYELGNTKTKTRRKFPIQQLVHSSSASAFQSCPSDSMLSGRYRNGKDSIPSSRYKNGQ